MNSRTLNRYPLQAQNALKGYARLEVFESDRDRRASLRL